jgi:catechol 2,3-dioxygenase-like lactoylglutathione lyase family enzyme
MRFTGMNHIALRVADLERSAKFYKAAFGMRHFEPVEPGRNFLPRASPDLAMPIWLSSSPAHGTAAATEPSGTLPRA